MSGIVTIKVNSNEFKCVECLHKAVDSLNMRQTLSANGINIIEKDGVGMFSIQKNVYNYQSQIIKPELQKRLDETFNKVLPKYTEYHAIHTLIEKGFAHQKTYDIENGKRMIFQRSVGEGSTARIERYSIDVFPNEGRIIIDGGDMPTTTCRKYIKKFEDSMGEFVSFQPHNSVTTQQKVETKQKTKQEIKFR